MNRLSRTIIASSAFLMPALALAQADPDAVVVSGDPLPAAAVGGIMAGLGIFVLVFMAIGIASFVFWLMMLIHAASKPIDNKALWIVLLVFTGIVGAIVYYFVVKRPFDAGNQPIAAPAAPTADPAPAAAPPAAAPEAAPPAQPEAPAEGQEPPAQV